MAKASAPQIDNEIYNRLGDRWYDAWDDPVALLRRESIVKLAWMKERLPAGRLKILDQGCGAGLVANELASWEHEVTGVDVSESSLQVGRERDKTQSVDYICTDALNTGLEEESYDVIVNFDFLEHVDNPAAAVAEASRLLKPGGHFYFLTFKCLALGFTLNQFGLQASSSFRRGGTPMLSRCQAQKFFLSCFGGFYTN